ncbi:hypothetical protein E2C01_036310 [Portunus trituberculatus]|uniref:Uncharacterized protein n=1 Tax=Portunus trituberculatus TaxID=210409 RepID=A0A5B7FC41_PORTR|nr:hypothetical protein [Portunus trituberculatus]
MQEEKAEEKEKNKKEDEEAGEIKEAAGTIPVHAEGRPPAAAPHVITSLATLSVPAPSVLLGWREGAVVCVCGVVHCSASSPACRRSGQAFRVDKAATKLVATLGEFTPQ